MTYKFVNLFILQAEANQREKCPDGFYDNLYLTDKYPSLEAAMVENQYVTISTACDEEGKQGYHLKFNFNGKEKFLPLTVEPRFGEDALDNSQMLQEVVRMLQEVN